VTDTMDKETNERTDGRTDVWKKRRVSSSVHQSLRWSLTLNAQDTGFNSHRGTFEIICRLLDLN